MRSRLALILLALLGTTPLDVNADDDHERGLAAREAGRAMPLAELIRRVEAESPGQVLEVELEDEHGRLVYEIKLLRPGGRVVELLYDAASGAPLREGEG